MTTGPAGGQVWTTRKLLAWMGEAFAKAGIDEPRRCAEMLILHVLGCERVQLYTDADRPATPLERQALRDLTGRALKQEPVQYLIGEWEFFMTPLKIDRRVKIPQPATATIPEHVIQHCRATPGFGSGEKLGEGCLIADIGTGSGCIAIALAKHLPGAHVVATDISGEALELARENAAMNGVAERVDFLEGDLLGPLDAHPATRGKGSLHYLVSNPPYIPDDEWESADPAVGVQECVKKYEPEIALRGGADGLTFVRPLLEEGPRYLRPGGLLLVEVAASRAAEARAIAQTNAMLEAVSVLKDFEGLPRTVVARRKG